MDLTGSKPVRLDPPRKCSRCGKDITEKAETPREEASR